MPPVDSSATAIISSESLTCPVSAESAKAMITWTAGIKGVLFDVTGVLYESGPNGGKPVPGSPEALKKLRASGIPFRLCSNASTQTRGDFVNKLRRHGFELDESEVICPAPILAAILKQQQMRPYLLVHPGVAPEFQDLSTESPNCVVLGDAQEHFTYEKLNKACQLLLNMPEKRLFSMGAGKFYRRGGELVLDVGSYAKKLEFACDCTMEVCGKPSPTYYNNALAELGLSANEVVMIGDDILSDVGGAQKMGMKGVQVRTGKFRPQYDEPHPEVTPDGYCDNFMAAVEALLADRIGTST